MRKVLIIDDIRTNRLILKEILRENYEVLEAAGGTEALELLSREYTSVSAVLLDISMPGMDGYEVLRRIREDILLSQMPVIMITGGEDEQSRVLSLANGANDYVTKPYKSDVIRHCLKNHIAFHEAAEKVSTLQRDKLTRFYARETFFEKVGEAVKTHAPGYYILCCFDIDKFKIINDQYGVEKGDEVLQGIAEAFREGFEPVGGICCRVSADNFAVLYPSSFADSAEIAAIRERVSRAGNLATRIMFCIGRYVIDDVDMLPAVMYDRAMLAAASVKGRADSRIAYYDSAMRDRLLHEQKIVSDMEAALAGRQFEVWFQPQYNHSTEAMIGAEALVRWRHPEKGLIPPNDFIPIFERNGFIYALDAFVWEEVCRSLRKWLNEGRNPLPVSVNISRYDILQPDVIDVIAGLVEKYSLPNDLLRLEITESAFAEAAQRIVEVVRGFISMGFTVEIDDFGSGYSSLNVLKDVPAQILKLDMKFLENTDDSRRGGNIVESVVRMAKWLGMSVIAEGVETMEQADYLRSIGCNYIQGYLYAKPMPAEKYENHCRGIQKEERLLALETVENLDNNAFWDPESMDTLIFNSYVGAACIFELHEEKIEVIRSTKKYAEMVGGPAMSVETTLRLDWCAYLDDENKRLLIDAVESSKKTNTDVTVEFLFRDLPGCRSKTYLRATLRVIASTTNRCLVYNLVENVTARREAEQKERVISQKMQAIMANAGTGIRAMTINGRELKNVFTNDKYYELSGYTKAQYENDIINRFDIIHPEDRDWVEREILNACHPGDQRRLEFRIYTRGGVLRWLRAIVSVTGFADIEAPVQLCIFTDVTETMTALAQNQSMMNDMPGGFARMSVAPDGTIRLVYINDGMLKLIAMSRDEIMAIYAEDAMAGVHPDDLPVVKDAIDKMFSNGEAHSSRYRLKSGKGGYIWLSIFGRVTKDAAGDTFLNIYYTDATEQVKEEETKKALLDNLPCGAGVYEMKNQQMSLTYQNKSYWELVGLYNAAFPDPTPMSAVHQDDIPVIMRELSLAIQQRRDVSCDIRLRHVTKGYRPVHLVGRIKYKDDGGILIYATFTPNDIMNVSYQQMLPMVLSTIMEASNDFAFAKDEDFRYICCSPAFMRLAGIENETDAVGKSDYDLFPTDMAEQFRQNDVALFESGRPMVDFEETIRDSDGVTHYCLASKHILRDAYGAAIGIYGVSRDISRHRSAFEHFLHDSGE